MNTIYGKLGGASAVNTTDRELFRQALEALEKNIHYTQTHLQNFDAAYNRHPSTENERGVITDDIEDAFAAIGALRERLAQTEPPQRTWQGLTDEEIDEKTDFRATVRYFEAKLKEKNNGMA